MPRRRISIVFEFSTLNGGERSMLSVIDSLHQRENEFEFIAIGPPEGRLAEALKQRQIHHECWATHDETGIRRPAGEIEASLCRLITSLKPDLVHANSLAMSRLLGRISQRLTIATTGHLRDIIKLSRAAIADLNRNQVLVAVSEATLWFHVGQGIDANRVAVVHNGVDLDRFRPRPATGWLSRELGLVGAPDDNQTSGPDAGHGTRLIACIGQLGLRKGQDVLAAAAPLIASRIPDVHFLVIGERTSVKEESIQFERAIHQRFADHGLSSRLHMLGHRDDVAPILNEIDLLVHPAHQEPFGRVLLEATAAGVPIVATDVGGTSEIVVDGETGRLVAPRDPESLAAAVVAVFSNDRESQQFREKARQRAVAEFSIDFAAGRLATVWNSVLSRQAAQGIVTETT